MSKVRYAIQCNQSDFGEFEFLVHAQGPTSPSLNSVKSELTKILAEQWPEDVNDVITYAIVKLTIEEVL